MPEHSQNTGMRPVVKAGRPALMKGKYECCCLLQCAGEMRCTVQESFLQAFSKASSSPAECLTMQQACLA